MKYRKKPVVVEAYHLEDLSVKSVDEALLFMGKRNAILKTPPESDDSAELCLMIHTLEGDMLVSCGDYIIRGVNGEFYPCKPDIFEKTYEPVREETHELAG